MPEEHTYYVFAAVKRVGEGELDTRPIRVLSEEEFEETRLTIRLVEEYLTGFDAYVRWALADLDNTTAKARTESARESFQLSPGPVSSLLELRIINVCAVVKMYGEHVKALLGQMYGKESSELNDVNKQLSQLYDSSLPYRVCNHLRNALVHGSPAELLRSIFQTKLSETGEPVTSVEVRLSREGFRKHAQNAKVRDEVVALPYELELISTVTETANATMELHREMMHLLSPGVERATKWLAALFDEANAVLDDGEWPGFFEVSPAALEGGRITPLPMPHSVAGFVKRFIEGPASRLIISSRNGERFF